MVFWLIPVLISLAINIVAYLLAPKPKQAKPEAAQDAEGPTAEAGKPIPVPFGRITIKGLNVLWEGDRSKNSYEVDA